MTGTKLQRTRPGFLPFTSPLARDFGEMRDRMRRMMGEPFGNLFPEMLNEPRLQPVGWMPAVEISESDAEFTVIAELPGMNIKDVQVTFENGVLTLRGEKEEVREEKGEERKFHVWERSFGTFLRTFEFPATVDEEKIVAEQKDGVLEVHLPKRPGTRPQGRRIEVVARS